MTTTPSADPLGPFHAPTRTWFAEAFDAPTKAQRLAWPAIASGESTLLLAPTGSGKTLAAFLASIDRLMFEEVAPRASASRGSGSQARRLGAPAGAAESRRSKASVGAKRDTLKPSVRVLYISPLKALGVDIDRNLRAPVAGVAAVAERLASHGRGEPYRHLSVAVRSGDTPQKERQRILREPPDILITTPESLYLMLTGRARETLERVDTVIVDEIHVMVPTKRGAHLFLTLERLERLRRVAAERDGREHRPLQRIGLSATQRPLDEVARLLGGADATADPEEPARARPVRIVDASEPKRLSIRVEMPVEDMAKDARPRGYTPLVGAGPSTGGGGDGDDMDDPAEDGPPFMEPGEGVRPAMGPSAPSIWPAMHPRLLALVRDHRSTMIFVNSRRLAERLAAALNELASEEASAAALADDPEAPPPPPVEIALAHHGSVAKDKRAEIEDRLKRGDLPAIVATSSLELGIDMGAVDLVVQIEAPPSIASGIQRIGRSGRGVDIESSGVIFPKYRGDLLACAGATGRMLAGDVEETFYPRNPLDLLAQQIVATVGEGPIGADELYAMVRGAAPYAELPRGSFDGVLDLLSGRYPSDEFAELRPRVTWDRVAGVVSPRKGTARIAILNGGTIPDRGLYGVYLVGEGADGAGGARVGELDEEMVFETHAGDVFLLGASSWRVLEITKDRVLVAPAPGEPGKMPFWRGDGPGRPLEFGRAIGRLARELSRGPAGDDEPRRRRLVDRHALDPPAAERLLAYLRDQAEATGEPPSDTTILVESFLDEIGDWRVCVLTPLGARVHAPWAMAVAARLRAEEVGEVDFSWTDDGMVFRLPESPKPPPAEWFVPRSDEVERLVTEQLGGTALFAARFRENAARALLLPKRQPNRRQPLWMQRRKAADLLAVASRYPSFPILLETYRECLRDVFDLPGLVAVLRDVERRAVRVESVETKQPSPFASSLLFNYIGNFIYEGDAPLAERRAQALALDHTQLRELLGDAELRELLDADALEGLVLELQRLAEPSVRHADAAHDLLLSLGDLSREEVLARRHPGVSADEAAGWLERLLCERRVIAVRVAGEPRYAAAEDAGRLRDALGVNPPPGLPSALLESVADPLGDLVSRYARTHGPFAASDCARRLGLGEAPVRDALGRLAGAGRVVQGEFTPGGRGREWCDAAVLRTLKRRSLARLRRQVEAVPPEALARFLPVWHGITRPRRGLDGVLDAVEQLQGAPLAASVLEREVLPARVTDYHPGMLDDLCQAGEIVWQGVESLGATDGRIALFLADRFPYLCRTPLAPPSDGQDGFDPIEDAVRTLLADRGALRFDDLARATGEFPNDVLAALWRLVWRGEASNDTLAPLRSLAGSASSAREPGARRAAHAAGRRGRGGFRSRRAARLPGAEGRWSLLLPSGESLPSATQRMAAQAAQLLERHGVLTREHVAREQVVGGFAAVYPVLKAMEEAGKARRGYFVEGLGGAQFAAAGADDLLRARPGGDEPETHVLAATDPASPFGAAVGWPESAPLRGGEGAKPQRAAGARVIVSGGKLLGYLGRGGDALETFLSENEPERGDEAARLAKTLAERCAAGESMLLTRIDGGPAVASPLVERFARAGFVATLKGLLHRPGTPRDHGRRGRLATPRMRGASPSPGGEPGDDPFAGLR